MLTMAFSVASEPEVHQRYEELWLRAFLDALHDGTAHMGLPPIALDELRQRYALASISHIILNAGNVKELLNMMPKEEFAKLTGRWDPALTEVVHGLQTMTTRVLPCADEQLALCVAAVRHPRLDARLALCISPLA